jgi:hypothetical protein
MNATLIARETETFYNLTTGKGKEIGVDINSFGCSIYIQRNGLRGLPMGRHFFGADALVQAVEAYKAADIKTAIRALISELA